MFMQNPLMSNTASGTFFKYIYSYAILLKKSTSRSVCICVYVYIPGSCSNELFFLGLGPYHNEIPVLVRLPKQCRAWSVP